MNVLVIASIFPSRSRATFGTFVRARLEAVTRRGHTLRVLAPVPWAPPFARRGRNAAIAATPYDDQLGPLAVTYPRYLVLPKLGMTWHGAAMAHACARAEGRRQKAEGSHVVRPDEACILDELTTRRPNHPITQSPSSYTLHPAPYTLLDAHFLYPDGEAARRLSRRLGVPYVVTARGSDVMQFPKEPGMRSIIQRVLREAACVIAVSPTLAEEITALAGPDLRVRTIVNGVDAERFHPMPRVEARASLGLPLDSRIILGVGHLVATKRWHLAVRALAVLPTDVHLHLIGSGEERGALEALAREVGVAERAHLHGAQPSEALPAWYGAADVFCLPSAREGCPNVVLEALACGRPVVATAVGNVPDLVREGVSGQLVHSDTPEALAETLRRALAREWDATLIVGRHARTWDDVAREVEQVWEGALSFRRQAALQEAEA